jgi:Dna[CI] antecedent DciA-like protein
MIERVGDTVAGELARFGPSSGIAPIVEAWPSAVGPEIARNAWPARLGRDGTLRVHTKDSVWAFELGTRADEIRHRLGELAPARLVFAAGPLPEPEREAADVGSPARAEPSPEHDAKAASLVRGIRDEDLRKVVAKTIAASLAAAESGRSVW